MSTVDLTRGIGSFSKKSFELVLSLAAEMTVPFRRLDLQRDKRASEARDHNSGHILGYEGRQQYSSSGKTLSQGQEKLPPRREK